MVTRQADPEETHNPLWGGTRQAGAADLYVWSQPAHVMLVVALKRLDNENSFSLLSTLKSLSGRQAEHERPLVCWGSGANHSEFLHDTSSLAEPPGRCCQGSSGEKKRAGDLHLDGGPEGESDIPSMKSHEGKINNRLAGQHRRLLMWLVGLDTVSQSTS